MDGINAVIKPHCCCCHSTHFPLIASPAAVAQVQEANSFARELGLHCLYEIQIAKLELGGDIVNAVVVQLTELDEQVGARTGQWSMEEFRDKFATLVQESRNTPFSCSRALLARSLLALASLAQLSRTRAHTHTRAHARARAHTQAMHA